MQDAWRCSVFIFYLFVPGENKSETEHTCYRVTSPILYVDTANTGTLGLK